jgi:hypothetical protein
MAKQETLITKKRGPKPTGIGVLVGVRLQPDELEAVDQWRDDALGRPSRPEAIRRLIKRGLRSDG